MAESELARMRREIEETYAAMQQGLSGLAVTARHEIIRHKHQQLADQQDRLEKLVETEVARAMMVEAQDQAIKGTQPAGRGTVELPCRAVRVGDRLRRKRR